MRLVCFHAWLSPDDRIRVSMTFCLFSPPTVKLATSQTVALRLRSLNGDVYRNLIGISTVAEEDVPRIMPGFPEFSHLYARLISTDINSRMPYLRPPLAQSQIDLIKLWIQAGAPEHA